MVGRSRPPHESRSLTAKVIISPIVWAITPHLPRTVIGYELPLTALN